MATTSKLGYGNAENLDTAIANGIIDEKDLVITKDTSEFYYIRDDKSKQAIRPRTHVFDSNGQANEVTVSTDNKISVNVKVSAKADNSITLEEDGLYVAVPDAYTKAEADKKIKAVQTALDTHTANADIHVTNEQKATWDAKVSTEQLAAAKSEAIAAASADATTKANAARDAAKTYADGLNTAMDTRVKVVEGAITWKTIG